MKIRIEVVDGLIEDEVIVRCRQVDARITRIEGFLREETRGVALTFYKGDEEYFFPVTEVLFFETEGEKVYAHTGKDAFLIRKRLYELEQSLPRQFVRAGKSLILNVRKVYSIQKNLAASSLVQFAHSHKQVFVSRMYYKECKQRLDDERRTL